MIINFLYFIIYIIIIFLFLEVVFRSIYRLKNKTKYKILNTKIIENFFYDKHPYLTYTYKKNFYIPKQKLRSNNNSKNLQLFGVKTNSLGFANGISGGKEILIPKPLNMLRISCLGASTTAHYLRDKDNILSYPIALEENLNNKIKNFNSIEVNNYGIGGWNSADILINFILNVYDSKPNIVIVYHAFTIIIIN